MLLRPAFPALAFAALAALQPACATRSRETPDEGGGAGGAGGRGGSAPVCGNGIVEAGEACDGDCVIDCAEDGDACTIAARAGDAASCNVVCTTSLVSSCVTGDGCCPAGCAAPMDADCEPCDVRVPGDAGTIMQGIQKSPSPGVVCVGPGMYPEEITLRPHVSIRGSGPATRIVGHVSTMSLADADPAETVLRDLRIETTLGTAVTACPPDQSTCVSYLGLEGKTAALALERVSIEGGPTEPVYCVELEAYGGSTSLAIRDSVCHSNRGIRFVNIIQDAPITARLDVVRSRFEALETKAGQLEPIYLLVMHAAGDCGVAQAPAGTIVQALIQNNEFFRTKFAGVHVARCLSMTAEDEAKSSYLLLHNTFVPYEGAAGDDAYGIWAEGDLGLVPRLRVVNNLFFTTNATPVGGEPPDVDMGNLRLLISPFVDAAAGDLRLVYGSAPIDIGYSGYVAPDDKSGNARPLDGDGDGVALPDVGAHEYSP